MDLQKNLSDLRTTADPQGFILGTLDLRQTYSYAHIPMPKQRPAWNNSSSVLRHSTKMYSMPKAPRFTDPKVYCYGHQKLNYGNTLGHRATAMGYGTRAQIPEAFRHNKNTAGLEAPFYEIDDMTLRRSKSASAMRGRTIGPKWSAYTTARAPHRRDVHCPEQVKDNPGAKYDVSEKIGENAMKSSMHPRLKMFSDLDATYRLSQPGPQNYLVRQTLVTRTSSRPGLGYGKRHDFTHNPEQSSVPSPIYDIPGFCDKFKRTKSKNLPRVGH